MLEKDQLLYSDVTGRSYTVLTDEPAGQGGFGAVWPGESDRGQSVALKLCWDRNTWAGESYFGALVGGLKRFVGVQDSIVEHGLGRDLQFVLVSEWIDGGTIEDQLGGHPLLTEHSLRRELAGLLNDLSRVHRVGITHRDIKPANTFLRGGRLLLGDFGLATQALGPRSPAYFGTEAFSPKEHGVKTRNWEPKDDIYMLGLLALSLLTGSSVTTVDIDATLYQLLGPLEVSDELKYWLWHALGPRDFRFNDGQEAAAALRGGPPKSAPPPASLEGAGVVFTGTLSMTRREAAAVTKACGARVQDDVNSSTTVIVVGRLDPRKTIGAQAGRKLYDAWLLASRGRTVSVIDEETFVELSTRAKSHG